jgi:hypothetical protein
LSLKKIFHQTLVLCNISIWEKKFFYICTSLYKQYKESILSLYRLTNLEYLEIVFLNTTTRDQYLKKGLQICSFKSSGYDNSQFRNFMMINLNSVPIIDRELLNEFIITAMNNLVLKEVRLHSFCLLIVPDTEFLTNQ